MWFPRNLNLVLTRVNAVCTEPLLPLMLHSFISVKAFVGGGVGGGERRLVLTSERKVYSSRGTMAHQFHFITYNGQKIAERIRDAQ